MLVGIVKDNNFGRKGMGTQFYFDKWVNDLDNKVIFTQFKKIDDKK
jgi:hypothetical protein